MLLVSTIKFGTWTVIINNKNEGCKFISDIGKDDIVVLMIARHYPGLTLVKKKMKK